MIRAIYLDSTPLSLIAQRKNKNPNVMQCQLWLEGLLLHNIAVYIAEIVDYEVRRELVRAKKQTGIERLNEWQFNCELIPITSQAMLRASELWADARNRGVPTAEDCALDADVIFAAQVLGSAAENGHAKGEYIVATANVRHISRYVDCTEWRNITA